MNKVTEVYRIVDGVCQGWEVVELEVSEVLKDATVTQFVYNGRDWSKELFLAKYAEVFVDEMLDQYNSSFYDAVRASAGIMAAYAQTSDLHGGSIVYLGEGVVRYERAAYNRSGYINFDFIRNEKVDLRKRKLLTWK